MTGKTFGYPHQFRIGGLLERRHLGEQRCIVDAHLMLFGQRRQFVANGGTQHFRVHARQRAQVEFQGTLAADAVGVVATMDTAEVHCRLRHAELRVAEFLLPLPAQVHQFAHHLVHGLQGAMAQARIGRVAAAPKDVDALHHHPLVQADRLEPGRLADHRRTAQGPPGLGQGAGAGHRAFFVTGGENQQRLLEVVSQQGLHGFDDQGEKALHVATAQAHPAPVDLGQLERIGLPKLGVVGHGVAVPGQHQPARAAAVACQQVELARADLLDIAGKTQVPQPAGQQVDHRTVGLIQ
ncbi:hypothetical protein D3C78_882030 [compost metagenome]